MKAVFGNILACGLQLCQARIRCQAASSARRRCSEAWRRYVQYRNSSNISLSWRIFDSSFPDLALLCSKEFCWNFFTFCFAMRSSIRFQSRHATRENAEMKLDKCRRSSPASVCRRSPCMMLCWLILRSVGGRREVGESMEDLTPDVHNWPLGSSRKTQNRNLTNPRSVKLHRLGPCTLAQFYLTIPATDWFCQCTKYLGISGVYWSQVALKWMKLPMPILSRVISQSLNQTGLWTQHCDSSNV